MNRRLLTILVIAFVIAGLCAFMVARMLGSRLQATKPAATRYVVAANADIKLGTILAPAKCPQNDRALEVAENLLSDCQKRQGTALAVPQNAQ